MSELKNKMIIAEQDNDLSSSLTLFFSQKYVVVTARTLNDIKEHADSACIILIEAELIDQNTITTLKELKRVYSGLAIVVMGTTYTKGDLDVSSVGGFADAVVYKPFDVGRISRIISQMNAGRLFSHSSL